MSTSVDPVAWARDREAEGWEVLAVADHLFTSTRPFPHLWVTATAVAMATTTVKVTSAFANNLFRSPVEFAQASLALHAVSGGRFEAGLGAGWARDEMERTGRPFPSGAERVERYVEALQIVRALLHEGRCSFAGRWYQVDVDSIGPTADVAPRLVGSVGGPRMIAEAAPLLDVVELKAATSATRAGSLDLAALGRIPRSELARLAGAVRERNPDATLSFFAFGAASHDPRLTAIAATFSPDSLYGGFFGEPAKVLDSLYGLAEHGIERACFSPINDDAYELVAALR
jgi:alkanesulfonate monooxygenase SsuD/methylene tetrahydromethanopterin reductase-like flavin-dependent oxidoreductase (luciferase family)